MFKKIRFIIGVMSLLLLTTQKVKAQEDSLNSGKDIGDVFRSIFKKKIDTAKTNKKYHIAVLPAIGYSLQTGWAVNISSNMGFRTSNLPNQKLSSIYTSVTQSQYNQTIFPLAANIWTKGNKLNFITDFRFIKYPSDIYGLGEELILIKAIQSILLE